MTTLHKVWRWWVSLFSPAHGGKPDGPFIDVYGVQCCRCKGLMAKGKGEALPPGIVDWSRVAQFSTVNDANSWARRNGWYVGDGTDHRCPACLEKIKQGEDRGKTRGAIVRFTRSGGEWGLWE